MEDGTQGTTAEPTRDERTWAMLGHLSGLLGFVVPLANVIAPFLIWRLKREGNPFLDDQGREAVNFQISLSIYALAAGLLTLVVIGAPLLVALVVFCVVTVIMAALRADRGEAYRYPLNLRLIK